MKKMSIAVLILTLLVGAAFWYWRQSTAAGKVNYLTEAVARACKETAPEELRDQVISTLRAAQAAHH